MIKRGELSLVSNRWSSKQSVTVLAYISLRTDLMRNDVKRGREAAARYLTRRHRTQRYRAKHIKDKICRLWKTLGREDSSSVDEIYEDGVNRRTLPGLTSEEFQSIKAEIDAMKMCVALEHSPS